MNKMRKNALAAINAVVLVTGSLASPASATTSTVTGSLVCTGGKKLQVMVHTEYSFPAIFYLGNVKKHQDSGGYDHVYNFNVTGGAWKVTSNGNIKTVSDLCTAAVR